MRQNVFCRGTESFLLSDGRLSVQDPLIVLLKYHEHNSFHSSSKLTTFVQLR